MILTYEAIDTDGRRTSDTVEAADARQAVDQLRRHGLYVTQIGEQTGRGVHGARTSASSSRGLQPAR
ncbi:MAG: hypothetical protein WBE26_16350, partial [Phycisphaerae bacterium]